jgi:signal transduction histidine kinase
MQNTDQRSQACDMTPEELRKIPLFADLPQSDLLVLLESAETIQVEKGTLVIREGDHGDTMLVVLDGELEIFRESDGQDATLAIFGPGAFAGEMALVGGGPRSASAKATRDSRLLVIHKTAFDHLLKSSSQAAIAVLQTVLGRLKSTEAMLVNQEKMAALGRIAAGLAHELNNPAAALQRSTDQMQPMLSEWEAASLALDMDWFDEQQRATIELLRSEIGKCVAGLPKEDPLARSDREDRLTDWLDDRGIGNPWDIAANLASVCWDIDRLDELAGSLPENRIGAILEWFSAGCAIHSTLSEMRTSATQMSNIVAAVKTYSHMDRAPADRVNVNEGIENTLIILRYKLRGVNIVRNYCEGNPSIEGYPAELNQVWTNIIDNAVDAMDGKGSVVIDTSYDDHKVYVSITDSGPGIPPEILPHLFEPFFTTKSVGSGTGLGLHIAYNVIVQRHKGTIDVESEPGRTTFRIQLPRVGATGRPAERE